MINFRPMRMAYVLVMFVITLALYDLGAAMLLFLTTIDVNVQ